MVCNLLFILLAISKSISIKDDPSYGANKIAYPSDDPPIHTVDKINLPKMPLIWIEENIDNCLIEKNLLETEPAESTKNRYISEITCTEGKDLSSIFTNLNENVQSIMIDDYLPLLELDLNNLNHKIEVKISGIEEKHNNDGDDEEEIDLKLLSKFQKKKKSNISKRSSANQQLKLVGDINNKVYNLQISNLQIQIINSPLNVNSVTLDQCSLHSDSLSIETIRMFACVITHGRLSRSQQYNKIHVKQFTVTDYNYNGYSKPCYYITYSSDSLKITVRDFDDDTNNKVSIYDQILVDEIPFDCVIPYSCCEMVTLHAVSHFYHFNFEGPNIKTIPFNITCCYTIDVLYNDPQNNVGSLLVDEKYKVYISSDNEWDNKITEITAVYVTGFMKCLDIDTTHCSSNIKVNKLSHYLESGYDPDQDQIEGENIFQIKGVIEFNKNDMNGFVNEIKDMFSTGNVLDNVVNVLSVKLPNGETSYDFNNLDLAKNHFLQLNDDSIVNLNGGNLNIFLSKNSNKQTIKIGESNNDVKLSIFNQVESTLTINSLGNEKKDILINSESILENFLKVKADQNVKSITFNSIVLRNNGKIQNVNTEITVKANSISVESKSESEINGIEIVSNVNVTQTSHLNLVNAKIEQASLNLLLSSFDVADYNEKPILSGNYIDEPKQVSLISLLNENDNSSVIENYGYLLIEGIFTNCENWIKKISFGNTNFNNGVCSEKIGLNAVDENKKEYLFVNRVIQSKSKKLSGGAIAGIVIGCVAAVAIIIVVFVVIVMKQKKKKGVANESENKP